MDKSFWTRSRRKCKFCILFHFIFIFFQSYGGNCTHVVRLTAMNYLRASNSQLEQPGKRANMPCGIVESSKCGSARPLVRLTSLLFLTGWSHSVKCGAVRLRGSDGKTVQTAGSRASHCVAEDLRRWLPVFCGSGRLCYKSETCLDVVSRAFLGRLLPFICLALSSSSLSKSESLISSRKYFGLLRYIQAKKKESTIIHRNGGDLSVEDLTSRITRRC